MEWELDCFGHVINGYDYQLQVWVQGWTVQGCEHPPELKGEENCNSRRYAGKDIRCIEGHGHN